jgi:hypothetical protein
MKRLYWDDIDGRRELSCYLTGVGWGLLISGFATDTGLLFVIALMPLVVALLVRLHVMREDRRTIP